MNRKKLEEHILKHYDAEPEYLWYRSPNYAVFRHRNNQKWFALIMDVPKKKLGLSGDEILDVVNLKCAPFLIDSLLHEDGFFPAYHMSKTNWVTVALDGSVADEDLETLLDMSFENTASKTRCKN